MTRQTVDFEGRVQGVGFRFTTARIAGDYVVAGYVQNLPDGRVRLVAEGELDQVEAFVQAVREAMSRYLQNHTVETSDATGEFGEPGSVNSFGVRH